MAAVHSAVAALQKLEKERSAFNGPVHSEMVKPSGCDQHFLELSRALMEVFYIINQLLFRNKKKQIRDLKQSIADSWGTIKVNLPFINLFFILSFILRTHFTEQQMSLNKLCVFYICVSLHS